MDLRGDINNLQLLELDSGHKTRANKTVNLYNYLRFCDNIMCIAGPNNNLWLTEATGMDTSSYVMPNDSNLPPCRYLALTVSHLVYGVPPLRWPSADTSEV